MESWLRVCRLCGSSCGVMSSIFCPAGRLPDRPLADRVMAFAHVQITEGDGLPSLICHRCLYHIELVNEFKILCEQTDAVLRHRLSSMNESEEKIGNKCTENIVSCENGFNNINRSCSEKTDSQWIKDEPIDEIEGVDPPCEYDDDQYEDDENVDEDKDEYYKPSCPTCNKRFEYIHQLNRHILIHSQEPPFPCDFCNVIVNDKPSLRKHWREHAGKFTNVCQTCGDAFDSKASLMKHHKLHDKGKPHHCEICQKAFSFKSDLRKHIITHTGLKPYNCDICYKSFTRSTNLNKHKKLHSGKRPYGCADCDKLFASKGDLLRHSVIHTGEKPFKCSLCSLSFNRRDKLTRHSKVHESGRDHACTACNAAFSRKEDLTKHVQCSHSLPEMSRDRNSDNKAESEALVISVDPSHWSEDQMIVQSTVSMESDIKLRFSCYVCPTKFNHLCALQQHALTHSDQEPYTCIKCGKSFERSDKLKDHILTHLLKKKPFKQIIGGNNPFKCNKCEDVFKSLHLLHKDNITHINKETYQCLYCSKDFFVRIKVLKHIKEIHSNVLIKQSFQ